MDREILPRLSDHMGEPWEEMCRPFVRAFAAEGKLAVPAATRGLERCRAHQYVSDVC